MKKILVLLVLAVFLLGCKPSDDEPSKVEQVGEKVGEIKEIITEEKEKTLEEILEMKPNITEDEIETFIEESIRDVQDPIENAILSKKLEIGYDGLCMQNSGQELRDALPDLELIKTVEEDSDESLIKTGPEEYYYSKRGRSTFIINNNFDIIIEVCRGKILSVTSEKCVGVI
ncbi:hypothetical protein KY339_04445 [Candidatus Woesearchaeota archaeon]|nr:hypothetical protein [Candidatus Woesearchaeota archaeon]